MSTRQNRHITLLSSTDNPNRLEGAGEGCARLKLGTRKSDPDHTVPTTHRAEGNTPAKWRMDGAMSTVPATNEQGRGFDDDGRADGGGKSYK